MKPITREIMTSKLSTIHFQAPLKEAFDAMKERRFRHLPVVDDDGSVVGILSDRDVQRAMSPDTLEFDPKLRVEQFMSWPAKGVEQHEAVSMVVQRMLSEKVSAFLVFGANRAPLGIVTSDDLLRLLLSMLEREPASVRRSLASVLSEFGEELGIRHGLGYQ